MLLWWILGFSFLGSIGAVAGAGLVLRFPETVRRRGVPLLVSYASGTLLGAAFLGMLPAALAAAPAARVLPVVMAGMVAFFVLEKAVIWRHCHRGECEVHSQPAPLILIGDTLHNFVDGALIAGAFLTSMELGIAAALAVIAHEIPQEIGDFAILLEAGYSRARALTLNSLSAAATLPGAVLAYYWLGAVQGLVPYVLAVSAASFIYISTADLIPGLHRRTALSDSLQQLLLLLAGIATIAWLHSGGGA